MSKYEWFFVGLMLLLCAYVEWFAWLDRRARRRRKAHADRMDALRQERWDRMRQIALDEFDATCNRIEAEQRARREADPVWQEHVAEQNREWWE